MDRMEIRLAAALIRGVLASGGSMSVSRGTYAILALCSPEAAERLVSLVECEGDFSLPASSETPYTFRAFFSDD